MIRRSLWLVLLAGCTAEEVPEGPPPDPVVVYVAYEDHAALRATLDRYTEETGVLIIDRRGVADRIVDDLIENRVTPPADLMLTRSVVHVWRAAEESALRPLYAENVADRLPDWAMDPDKLWFAMTVERAVIAYRGAVPNVTDMSDLAEEEFAGRLCLSTSRQAINRTVIAMLIDALGVRPAEIVVRGWVSNLAQPFFASDEALAEAIADGTCDVGVVSATSAERVGLDYVEPLTHYADVTALGVGRHARNPDGAAQLAAWLIAESEIPRLARPDAKNVGTVAWLYEDAVKLAERARFD